MKAKLIKRDEVKKQTRRKTLASAATLKVKTATEVVREWVGEHQKTRQSAREAFSALFTEPQLKRMA